MATLTQLATLATSAAIISAVLIILLRPILMRYALARPNARSSHVKPTPQGGGIAVIVAMIVVIAGAVVLAPDLFKDLRQLAIVLSVSVGLAVVGVSDDVRPMEALPRLALQAIAVGVVIAALPVELRIVPMVPWWVERLCILISGIWLVNVTNFMDGIDWITVAEVVPITAALTAFGMMGALPNDATVVSLVLCGAIIGFAPFNRPVAQLFLGDVGSLPIGLLLGWLLFLLAAGGHRAAAFLLPLYYVADATITLLRRLTKGESITQAHRSHFYQRALGHGLTVFQIVQRIFIVNVLLCVLAACTLVAEATAAHIIILSMAGVLVCALLLDFDGRLRLRK